MFSCQTGNAWRNPYRGGGCGVDQWVGAKSVGAGWLWGLSHVSQNEQMFCQIHAHSSPTATIVKSSCELCSLWLPWINNGYSLVHAIRTGYSNEYSHQLAFEFVLVRLFTCALSASYHQADIITNRKTNKNTRYLHKYVENDPQTPLHPSLCRPLLLQLFLLSNPLSRWREAKLLELLGVILAGLCSNGCLEKPWKVVDSTMCDGQNSPLQLP